MYPKKTVHDHNDALEHDGGGDNEKGCKDHDDVSCESSAGGEDESF